VARSETGHNKAATGHNKMLIDSKLIPDENRVSANIVLENATHVMVPKRPIILPALQLGEKVCGSYVREHFEKTAEPPYWKLYMRHRKEVARAQCLAHRRWWCGLVPQKIVWQF